MYLYARCTDLSLSNFSIRILNYSDGVRCGVFFCFFHFISYILCSNLLRVISNFRYGSKIDGQSTENMKNNLQNLCRQWWTQHVMEWWEIYTQRHRGHMLPIHPIQTWTPWHGIHRWIQPTPQWLSFQGCLVWPHLTWPACQDKFNSFQCPQTIVW
jgi:hypothetical protein